MTATRPIDSFPKPSGWKHTIAQALRLGRCGKCGRPVRRFTDEASKREYQLSSMCQACQDDFYSEEQE